MVADVLPTEFRRAQLRSPAAIPAELTALFGSDRPAAFGEHKKTTGVIYEQTVSAFLEACLDPDLPNAPQNAGQVLEDMRQLWLERGFIPPHELKLALMQRYAPDLPPAAFDTMKELLVSRYEDLEPLTGFQRKQHAPITTGLAHLYAVLTDRPATMVEFDFLNMGGTNEHFRKLMAAAKMVDPSQIDEHEAWKLTDQSARIIAGVAREAMRVGARHYGVDGAAIHGFRTGGDEMRLVCVGLTQAQSEQIIRDYVQPAIEKFSAEAGLQDHEHSKARDDDWRRGFGAVCSTIPLDRHTQPGHELEQVDQRIAENKLMVGIRRQGRLPALENSAPGTVLEQFADRLPPELRDLLTLARSAGLSDEDEGESGDEGEEEGGKARPESSLQFAAPDPGCEDESTMDPAKAAKQKSGGGRKKKKKTRLEKLSRKELEKRLSGLGIKGDLSKTGDGELRDLVQTTVAYKLQNDMQRHAAHYADLKARCGTLYTPERSPHGVPDAMRSQQPYHMLPERAAALLKASRDVIQIRYGRLLTNAPGSPSPFANLQLPPTLFRTPIERDTQLMHTALQGRGVTLNPAQRKLFENMLASSSPVDSATRTYVGDVMPEIFGQFAKDAERLRAHLSRNPQLMNGLGHPNLADIKARSMAVSMENLAGVNKLLGHDNANIVLNHFAQNIVLKSFEAAGVKIGRESVEIGHDGGGRMLLAIRPIVGTAGNARILSDHDMAAAQGEINRRMQEFKTTNIFAFLEQTNGTIPKGLDPKMTMADIADGKGRPELKGLDATTSIRTLNYQNAQGDVIRGGENKDALVKQVESDISAKRAEALKVYLQNEAQRRQNDGQGTRQTHQAIQWHPLLGKEQDNQAGRDGSDRPESGQRRGSGPVQRPN